MQISMTYLKAKLVFNKNQAENTAKNLYKHQELIYTIPFLSSMVDLFNGKVISNTKWLLVSCFLYFLNVKYTVKAILVRHLHCMVSWLSNQTLWPKLPVTFVYVYSTLLFMSKECHINPITNSIHLARNDSTH